MKISIQNHSSKLGAALATLSLASALAPNALAQCVSGDSSAHVYGAYNADFLNATVKDDNGGTKVVPLFRKPTKVVPAPGGAYVLDDSALVGFTLTTDPATGVQSFTPTLTKNLIAPAVDMIASGTNGARILYANGRESGTGIFSTPHTSGYDQPNVPSIWSVTVTQQRPVAIANAGGYDWVTDGSNVLYQVTLPKYDTSDPFAPPVLLSSASVKKIPTSNQNAALGIMVSDGVSLWVVSNGTTLARVDPSTGQVVGSLSNVGRIDTLTFDGTFLWTGDSSGVREIDPVTGQQVLDHPAALPGPVTGLFLDGSWVWAANGTGTLPRARTCDAATLGGITLPGNAQTVTSAAGALWIIYSNSPMVSVR